MHEASEVPLRVRVVLAHAAVQHLATAHGVDLLHLKGPAVLPHLRGLSHRRGTDADVLVRPAHVDRLMAALEQHGWQAETTFTTGSAFDHAANLFHPHWGMLDVHRTYPGMDRDPAAAFAVLWARRGSTDLAHVPCPVPDPLAQSLVLLLHAARTPHDGGPHPDLGPNWTDRSDTDRAALRALAGETGATVALAAATGDLGGHAGAPEAAVWEVFADGGDRLDEWTARWRAARGPTAKASVALRSVRVNRYYLRQRLGHDPSRAEMSAELVRRVGRAGRALWSRAGRR